MQLIEVMFTFYGFIHSKRLFQTWTSHCIILTEKGGVMMTNQVALNLDIIGSTTNTKNSVKQSKQNFEVCLSEAGQNKQSSQQEAKKLTQSEHKDLYNENCSKTKKKQLADAEPVKETEENSLENVNPVEAKKEIEKELVQSITEILGISEEELNSILANLNLTVLDLCLKDNMQQFLQAFFQVEDPLVLLLDADMSDKISELNGSIKKALKSLEEQDIPIQQVVTNIQNNSLPVQHSESPEQAKAQEVTSSDKVLVNSEEHTVEVIDQRTTETNDSLVQNGQNAIESDVLDTSMLQSNEIKDVQPQAFVMNHEGVPSQVEVADLIQQITEHVNVTLKDDSSSMVLQLKPEFLGKLTFAVTSEEGIVTARFMAGNTFVKDLIDNNLAYLKTSLEEQGIEVNKMEVVVGDDGLLQNKEQEQFKDPSNKRRKKYAVRIESEEAEDNVQPKELENESQMIDYVV